MAEPTIQQLFDLSGKIALVTGGARNLGRGMAGVFRLSSPSQQEYILRLRGLDIGARYQVTWDNLGQTCEVDGFTLMKQGLAVRLDGALTSELLLFAAV